MRNNPKVSIIILNWNGKKWLKECLPTIQKIKYKPLEVIVVNNGSTDDSKEFVRNNFPKVKLIELKKNRGFAGANNFGVKKANGKYVLLLNNDTEVTASFLEPLVDRMEKDESIGAIQPQLRSLRNKALIDSAASFYTSTGFLYHYGYYQEYKKKQYKKDLFVYSIKGACMFMRKKDYIELGGLDEEFVCYVEESDLCHRIWLSGKKVLYTPIRHIYHFGGGDMSVMEKSETTVFRVFRNRIFSYLKNLGGLELIKVLPLHLIMSEVFILLMISRGKLKNAFYAQIGIIWCFINIFHILEKRKIVQTKIRKVRDQDFLPSIRINPSFSYYVHFFKDPEARYNEKEIKQ